jgi:hypothetical protein
VVRLLIFLILAAGAYFFWYEPPALVYADKVLVSKEPLQGSASKAPWTYQTYRVEALASFSLEARVLAKERYYILRESDLSPYDLALGWMEMSRQSVVDASRIAQRNRFYFYKYNNLISPDSMVRMSSNMHIVPGNDHVKGILKKIRVGDIIALQGYLVRIESKDGWYWVSSLSRTDTMGGACEVVWVENLEIRTHNYGTLLIE